MVLSRRRFVASATLTLTASRAIAQSAPLRVLVVTGQGQITLELAVDRAPLTCRNFLRYVDAKRYDGASIYRAMRNPWDAKTGLLQAGLQNDPAKLFPPVAHEPTSQTGLSHVDGTISLARWAPGSGASDFFFCLGDNTYLDAKPAAPGDNLGFAAFGQVVEGMDVVRQVHAMPTSPTAGEGVMKGQMLAPVVGIATMRRAV